MGSTKSSWLVSLPPRPCSPAAYRQRFVPSDSPALSAYYVLVWAHRLDKRPLFPVFFSHSCAAHTPAPSRPQALQALLLANPSPGGGWSPAGVPGGAISGPPHLPTSLVALKTALWRTDGGCLPPGRFISSFFKPCSDFSMSASLVPPTPPSACFPALPLQSVSPARREGHWPPR